jgi:polysaccharide lyase-like protein
MLSNWIHPSFVSLWNGVRTRGPRTTLLLVVLIVGGTLAIGAQSAAPPALLEGSGLAAAYPNDSGITGNSSVLFADGFENYTSASQLSTNYSNYYQGSNIAFDTSTFVGGTKSLRIRQPASGVEVSNAIVKTISPARDALYMRVYARYASNYAGMNSAHNGLRITGKYTGPGRRPNGTDFFLVSVENSRWGSDPEPGYTHAYVYHPEQDDVYGEHWFPDGSVTNGTQSFGSYFVSRPKVLPARGVWICFEILVKMNTPGTRDGRVAVWQDGRLVADWQSVRFRDVDTLKIDEIQLENGGQGSSQQNDKWYDNLVIATSYIGPIGTGTSTAPRPPTNVRIQP